MKERERFARPNAKYPDLSDRGKREMFQVFPHVLFVFHHIPQTKVYRYRRSDQH